MRRNNDTDAGIALGFLDFVTPLQQDPNFSAFRRLRGGKFLDVGCKYGLMPNYVGQVFETEAYGVDELWNISPEYIPPERAFGQTRFQDLPAELNGQFDVINASGLSFHGNAQLREFAYHFNRLLKDDGLCMVGFDSGVSQVMVEHYKIYFRNVTVYDHKTEDDRGTYNHYLHSNRSILFAGEPKREREVPDPNAEKTGRTIS